MKTDFSDRIERELLCALLDYLAPVLHRKIKAPKNKNPSGSGLENIVLNSRPKISFDLITRIEDLFSNHIQDAKIKSSSMIEASGFIHRFSLTRKKQSSDNSYSVNITYEENSTRDKLKISVKKEKKEIYSTEIINKKEIQDRVAPYKFAINYEDHYGEERLSITYRQQLDKYMKRHAQSKEDMSERVPLKWVNVLPETMMGGVLGFTYIGDPSMGRRADLTGWMARMVDIHESIHTPDEYETRVLTSWIMEKARGKYIK